MKQFLLILIVLSLLLPSNSFGESLVLKKGDPAPTAGLFFSQKDAQTLQNDLKDYAIQKQIVTSQSTEIKLLQTNSDDDNKRIQMLSTQNDTLAKEDVSNRTLTTVEKTLYFIAGMAAMYGAVRLAQTIK